MEYIINTDNNKNGNAHFNSVDDLIEVANNLRDNNLQGVKNVNNHSATMNHLTLNNSGEDLSWFGGIDHKDTAINFENRVCHSESIRKRIHAGALGTMFNTNDIAPIEGLNIFHDECGLMLDSNAYFNGEEECMVNYDLDTQVKPIVWLACSMGGSASQNDDYFINRGIALIRAIHALERAGVSVGLVAYARSKSGGERGFLTVVVKQPQNSLDETTLINTFATPSLFRHYGIFFLHIFITSGGCGQLCEPEKDQFEKGYAKGHKLVVIPQHGDFDCPDEATKDIMSEVKQQASIAA